MSLVVSVKCLQEHRTQPGHSVAAGLHDISARILASNSFQVSLAPGQRLSIVVSSSEVSHSLSFRDDSDSLRITSRVVKEASGIIPIAAGCSNEVQSYLSVCQVTLHARSNIFTQSFPTNSLFCDPKWELV